MKAPTAQANEGSTIVVTISVVAGILVMLASAVGYTQHISRMADRSRKTAQALEIADGHLEYLFSSWRNIYRKTWTTNTIGALDAAVVGTNYFYTANYSPSNGCTYNGAPCPQPTPIPNMNPAATPAPIPLISAANFPKSSAYTVEQYRIQAVDPMVTLNPETGVSLAEDQSAKGKGNWTAMSPAAVPPPAYGPNSWQYSFYYLASVDVTIPAMNGTVTARVRRVFEKKFDNPWTYAMFYVDDLEFSPESSFTIDGPVHTNGNLYISTSSFNALDVVGYSGEYVNAYSPQDTSSRSGSITAPNFPQGLPPVQQAAMLPFGWDLKLSTSDTNQNNESYHELIEVRESTQTDPLSAVRIATQADYQIFIDSSNNITAKDKAGATVSGGTLNNIRNAITTNVAIRDPREATNVRLASVNVATLTSALSGAKIIYIKDTTPVTSVVPSRIGGTGSNVNTTQRAIRFTNGAVLPSGGLTLVSENPVYIQGNFNTGSGTVPSNASTPDFTKPTVSGYSRRGAAVMGDAITILSNSWSDTNSSSSISSRVAGSTTINAALVGGTVPSGGGEYSGGGENFIRYLEDWRTSSFCYYGSMVQLFNSKTAVGPWTGAGSVYKSPLNSRWFYDTNFGTSSPPGNLQIASYLQQQRWYQVY